ELCVVDGLPPARAAGPAGPGLRRVFHSAAAVTAGAIPAPERLGPGVGRAITAGPGPPRPRSARRSRSPREGDPLRCRRHRNRSRRRRPGRARTAKPGDDACEAILEIGEGEWARPRRTPDGGDAD